MSLFGLRVSCSQTDSHAGACLGASGTLHRQIISRTDTFADGLGARMFSYSSSSEIVNLSTGSVDVLSGFALVDDFYRVLELPVMQRSTQKNLILHREFTLLLPSLLLMRCLLLLPDKVITLLRTGPMLPSRVPYLLTPMVTVLQMALSRLALCNHLILMQ